MPGDAPKSRCKGYFEGCLCVYIYIYGSPPELSTSFGVNTVIYIYIYL